MILKCFFYELMQSCIRKRKERIIMEKSNHLNSQCFTSLIILYPILAVYFVRIVEISLSLADVFLLMMFPYLIFRLVSRRIITYEKTTLLLLFYTVFHLMLFAEPGVIIDTGHFILVLLVLSFFVPNFFNREYGVRLLITVAFCSSVYLIIQVFLLKGFGIYIPGQFTFLQSSTAVTGNIRPFSFFSEPSAFGWYNSIGLATVLYNKTINDRKKMILATVITLALFMSMSTTSMGLMVIVWAIWIKDNKQRRSNWILGIIIIGIPILTLVNIRYGIVDEIIQHSFAGLTTGEYAQGLTNRTGDIFTAFSYFEENEFVKKVFGIGMIDISRLANFLPTVARMYVFYGIIGYIVYGIYFSGKFIESGKYGKCIIILATVAMFFSESVFGLMLLWYMPYVLSWKKEDYIYEKRCYSDISE